MSRYFIIVMSIIIMVGCNPSSAQKSESEVDGTELVLNQKEESISVYRKGETEPLLIQNAKEDFRPYIHPISSPDGKGELTQYSLRTP